MGAITIKVITRSGKPLTDVSVGSEVRWRVQEGLGSDDQNRGAFRLDPPSRGARAPPDAGCPCINPQDTVAALKKKIHAAKKTYYPARQRLTLPPAPGQKSGDAPKDSATLSSLGLKDGSVVYFKDLGTQVRWEGRAQRTAPRPRPRRAGRGGRGAVSVQAGDSGRAPPRRQQRRARQPVDAAPGPQPLAR
jgi:hypothetical protein